MGRITRVREGVLAHGLRLHASLRLGRDGHRHRNRPHGAKLQVGRPGQRTLRDVPLSDMWLIYGAHGPMVRQIRIPVAYCNIERGRDSHFIHNLDIYTEL